MLHVAETASVPAVKQIPAYAKQLVGHTSIILVMSGLLLAKDAARRKLLDVHRASHTIYGGQSPSAVHAGWVGAPHAARGAPMHVDA